VGAPSEPHAMGTAVLPALQGHFIADAGTSIESEAFEGFVPSRLHALDRYWSERTALISTHHHRELAAAQSAVEQVSPLTLHAYTRLHACMHPQHHQQHGRRPWAAACPAQCLPTACNYQGGARSGPRKAPHMLQSHVRRSDDTVPAGMRQPGTTAMAAKRAPVLMPSLTGDRAADEAERGRAAGAGRSGGGQPGVGAAAHREGGGTAVRRRAMAPAGPGASFCDWLAFTIVSLLLDT